MSRQLTMLCGLLSIAAWCQAQLTARDIAGKFEAYNSDMPKTQLRLVFNQPKYCPGDTAFFKAYFLFESRDRVPGRQLITLDMLNSKGESIRHFLFEVNDGIGFNQVIIPDSIAAGVYLVTAYSPWMRNFGAECFFRKRIMIVTGKKIREELQGLQAAVEGGKIVAGITTRIFFRTSPNSDVEILEESNTFVTKAIADKFGIGSMLLNPRSNTRYFIRERNNGKRMALPATQEVGGVLSYLEADSTGPERIQAIMSQGFLIPGHPVIAVLSSQGKIYDMITIDGEKESFTISLQKLPGGVAQCSLLNEYGELISIRNFFKSYDHPVRLEGMAAKSRYEKREKVTLKLAVRDDLGVPVAGEFSVRAINRSAFGENELDPFELMAPGFSSEWTDLMPSAWPSRFNDYLAFDNEPLPWKAIFSPQPVSPAYSFSESLSLRGVVYDQDSDKPLSAVTELMVYAQSDRMRYNTFTWEGGRFDLTLFDIYGEDRLFLLAKEPNGRIISNLRIEWLDDHMSLAPAPDSRVFEEDDPYADYESKRMAINQSYGFYSGALEKKRSMAPPLAQLEQSMGGADITINLQEYVVLPTMEEVVKEIIPSLRHRKDGGKSIIRVTIPEPMVPDEDPVYIIDGLATRNTDYFLSLDPEELLAVKIINAPKKLLPLGLLGKNGIVIIISKRGELAPPVDDPSKIISGLNRPLPFVFPDYSKPVDRHLPDFRASVYWAPSVKTDAKGEATVEFYTSDDRGPIQVDCAGMTTDGRPFHTTLVLDVSASTGQR